MIINHPLLGPRDSEEFVYLGSTDLINRPDWEGETAAEDFHQYQYIRENPAGDNPELWYHEQGDQSWLVVIRSTLTHDIKSVELAEDYARRMGRSK
jgi:sarcosine oxidase subunit delta